eukprot:sb/3477477/
MAEASETAQISTSPVDEKKEEEGERDAWGAKTEYMLALIGYAVGIGNIWRFPYLCHRYGGATQIFYSLGIAFGSVVAYSSYNKKNNNCLLGKHRNRPTQVNSQSELII